MNVKKEYNLGLAILRAIMCFMVVLCHFWDANDAKGILRIFRWARDASVHVFMMMSFMFVQNTLVEHNTDKIKKRFERLLIPQVGWAVIYWAIYKLIDIIFDAQLVNGITDLIWQILWGHSPRLNATMWYQADLIYLTILFLLVIIIFKRNYSIILWILGAVALFMQYSGINLIFDGWRYELKYPIGRFFEMLPMAVVGFMVVSNQILEKLKENRCLSIGMSVFTIIMVAKYEIFLNVPGYEYQGIKWIIVAFAFVTLFYCIPFEKIPHKVAGMINVVTSYTMGIYCMHRLIATFLNKLISKLEIPIEIYSFEECILIYIVCFICAWAGTKIVGKTKWNTLFS